MTTALAYKTSEVPRVKVTTVATPRISFITACTPPPVDIVSCKGGYTDEQFYADLKKASKRLDAMEAEALEEDAQGKTRKFPV